MEELVRTVTVYALPVLFAITLHEAAHGYVAKHFGDKTAYVLGRVSLNPIRHIDPVGTIAVPLGILVLGSLMGAGGLLFGWAKPVPVNFHALRHPKRDMLWVAAAGPGANLFMALAWAVWLKGTLLAGLDPAHFVVQVGQAGIVVNLVLMVLNLLPLLPLDGGRILFSLLPDRLAMNYARTEPFGFPILLVLLFTNVLGFILYPMVTASMSVIGQLFQI
jgi:Zn-dependent protease